MTNEDDFAAFIRSLEERSTFRCPPDHRHGETANCYCTHRCRCDDCRAGRARQQRRVYRAKAYGTYEAPIPAIGMQRRMQALIANGWSLAAMGQRLGVSRQVMRTVFERTRTNRATHEVIAALYDDMWDMKPPATTPREKQTIARNKAWAKREGWLPPLAWDDDAIDIPEGVADQEAPAVPEQPTPWGERLDQSVVDAALAGDQPRLAPRETREVISILNEYRWSARRIADHLGCNKKTVERVRKELGLPIYLYNDTTYRKVA